MIRTIRSHLGPSRRVGVSSLAALALLLAACGGSEVEEGDAGATADGDASAEVEDDGALTEESDEAPDDAGDPPSARTTDGEAEDDAPPAPTPDGGDEGATSDDPGTSDPGGSDPVPGAEAPDDEPPASAPSDEDGSAAPGGDCSAQGHEVEVTPADELPAEVASLRSFLIDAALRCDEQLLFTAIEESDAFNASFGGTTDPIGLWWELEEAGEEPYLRLAEVLATTPGLAEGGEVYVWPRVATGRPEDTTPEAWDEVTWAEDAAADAQGVGYLDWRAGISTDGQWRFFVRGD